MSFLKVTFWGGLYSLFRLACGLAVTKVLAIYTGPAGLALFGQFQSLVSLSYNFSNAGITNGIIKHVAEYSDRPYEQARLMQTATLITLAATALISLGLILGSHSLSISLLRSAEYRCAISLLGTLLVFSSLSLSFAAQLNGHLRSLSYFAIQTFSSLTLLCLVVVLVPGFDLQGAFISIPVAQVLVFVLTVFVCIRISGISTFTWRPVWHSDMARRLVGYSAAALVTAIALPGTQLIVRDIIISSVSIESAGFWQASLRISDALMVTVTSVLTPYYLPRIAASNGAKAISKHVRQFLTMVIPGFVGVLLIVFTVRSAIIQILFTDAFASAERLFAVQFVGDLLKMAGWILSTVLISRGRTSWVIVSELGFAVVFVVLARLCVPQFDELGGNLAYLGATAFSSVLLLSLYRHLLTTGGVHSQLSERKI